MANFAPTWVPFLSYPPSAPNSMAYWYVLKINCNLKGNPIQLRNNYGGATLSYLQLSAYRSNTNRAIETIRYTLKIATSSERLPQIITKACAFETLWRNTPKGKDETEAAHAQELFRDVTTLNNLRRDMLASSENQNDVNDSFDASHLVQDIMKRCPILTSHIIERISQIAQHIGIEALGDSPYSHKDVPPFDTIT